MALLLASCGTPSTNVYNPDDVGRMVEVAEARVVTSRAVYIEAPDSGSGGSLGGLAGGIGTAVAIGGQFGGPIGFLIGTAVGYVIGYVVEDMATDGEGIEYILILDDGRIITIVQNAEEDEEPLAPGSEVYVQFGGNYSRVLPRADVPQASSGNEWINPDDLPIAPGAPPDPSQIPVDDPEASQPSQPPLPQRTPRTEP